MTHQGARAERVCEETTRENPALSPIRRLRHASQRRGAGGPDGTLEGRAFLPLKGPFGPPATDVPARAAPADAGLSPATGADRRPLPSGRVPGWGDGREHREAVCVGLGADPTGPYEREH